MHAMRRVISGLAFLAASNLSHPAHAQECSRDRDCPGDAICEQGICIGEDGVRQPPASRIGASDNPSAGSSAPAPGAEKASVKVPVEFVLRGSGSLEITEPDSGTTCVAPCILRMAPGTRRVLVDEREETVVVPASKDGARYSVGERDGAALGIGVTLLLLGGGALVGSAIPAVADSEEYSGEESGMKAAHWGLIAGAVLCSVGVPLVLVADSGGIRQPDGSERRPTSGGAVRITPRASVTREGGGIGVALTF